MPTAQQYIYELLNQVLDPCQMFDNLNEYNGDKLIEQFINVNVKSIIVENGKTVDTGINTDITANVSNFLKSSLFETEFLELMGCTIEYFGDNDSYNNNNDTNYAKKFFDLGKNSLYIWNLLKLSKAIPSEVVMNKDFNYFQIYSARTLNQTINETINYPSGVTLPNQEIIQQGRESFNSLYSLFNSIDFVVVKLKLTFSTNHEINGSRQIDEAMPIHVLSNSIEAYALRLIRLGKNISITFEIPQDVTSMNNSDRIKVHFNCGWYNGSEKMFNLTTMK